MFAPLPVRLPAIVLLQSSVLPVTPEILMPSPSLIFIALVLPKITQLRMMVFSPEASSRPMPLLLVAERNRQPCTIVVPPPLAAMRKDPIVELPQLRMNVMLLTVTLPEAPEQ